MPPDYDLEREIQQLEQRYAENVHGLVFAHLADAYRRAGEYGKAEGLILHGLKTHPNYTSAYNVLGRVYLESERFSEAQDQFSKVLELDPQNLIALRALGDLAARRGDTDDARLWYERMLQIDPRSQEASEGLRRLAGGDVEPPSPDAEGPPFAAEVLPPPTEDEALAEDYAPFDLYHELETPHAAEVESQEPVEEAELIETSSEEDWMRGDSFGLFPEMPAPPEAVSEPETPAGEPLSPELEPPSPEIDWGALEAEPLAAEGQPLWEQSPETTEPAEAPTEEPAGLAAEQEDEAATPEGLDIPSMDDWSPGFVVGELLEGQASEDLRAEELLEGLSEEFPFDLSDEAPIEAETVAEEEEPHARDAVVTETMAELYVSQGLYSDALGVYRRLAEASPEDERLRARIADLEQRIAEAGSVADLGEEELARLMKLTEPVAEEPGAAPEPAVETFQFEDEAPLAGFEQLDPFAASFDVMATKGEPVEAGAVEPPEPEPEAPMAEQPAEIEPAAPVAEVPAAAEPVAAAPLEPAEPGEAEPVPVEFLEEEEPVPVEFLEEAEPVPVEFLEQEEPVTVEFLEEEEPVTVEPLDEEEPVLVEFLEEEPVLAEPLEAIEAVEVEAVSTEPVAEDVAAEVAEEIAAEIAEEIAGEVVAEDSADVVEAAAPEPEIKAVDTIWELTEVGMTEAGEEQPTPEVTGEAEVAGIAAHVPATEAEMAKDVEEPTVEGYLSNLLAFDVESRSKQEGPGDSEAIDEPQPAPEASGAEDLEQFQEWLRSLKR